MSDIKFYCTSCGKKLGIDARAIGMSVSCPRCNTHLRVPEKSEDPAAAEMPPTPAPPLPPVSRPSTTVMGVQAKRSSLLTPTPKPPPISPLRPKPPPMHPPPSVTQPVQVLPESAPLSPGSKELEAMNRMLQKQEEQNRSLVSDLESARAALSSMERERDRIRGELKEKEMSAVSGTSEKINALNNTIQSLTGEKAELESQLNRLTGEHSAQQSRISELESSLKKQRADMGKAAGASASFAENQKILEQKNTGLSREVDRLKKDLAQAHGSSSITADSLLKLEKQNTALSGSLTSVTAECEKVKKERDELLVYRKDAKALSSAMSELQAELKDLKEQEKILKKTVEVAEDKISKSSRNIQPASPEQSGPWQYDDPIQRARKWTIIFAGVAVGAVICSILFVVFWPGGLSIRLPGDAPAAVQDEMWDASVNSDVQAMLGEAFEIDGVEVLMSRARIAPVEIITLLNVRELSKELYFIFDIKLKNVSGEKIILRKPWREARLVDNNGRLLKTAFKEPSELQDVTGLTQEAALDPGEELSSIIVFEWIASEADSFTLTVDPGFGRLAEDGRFRQISFSSIEVNVRRDQLQ